MSYERMRIEMLAELSQRMDTESASIVLQIMDTVANKYEITTKETALSVPGSFPEILKVFISSKAVENVSMKTLAFYKTTLLNFLQTVQKSYMNITANDIRVYLFNYREQRHVKGATVENIRSIINSFYTWLVDEEYIDKNPCTKVQVIRSEPPQRHAMTLLELEKLRQLCETKQEKATVDFLYSTGCRVSEMCNMKKADVDWTEKTVTVRRGKGGKSRITYLNPEAVVSLSSYINSRTDDCEYLFTSKRFARKMSVRSVEVGIDKIISRAPECFNTHITPHVFRHTAATTALRNGMPIDQVKRFLGHSKVTTTLIYAATDDSIVKAMHQRCVG